MWSLVSEHTKFRASGFRPRNFRALRAGATGASIEKGLSEDLRAEKHASSRTQFNGSGFSLQVCKHGLCRVWSGAERFGKPVGAARDPQWPSSYTQPKEPCSLPRKALWGAYTVANLKLQTCTFCDLRFKVGTVRLYSLNPNSSKLHGCLKPTSLSPSGNC